MEQSSEQAPDQAVSPQAPQPPTDVSGGKPWIDSSLKDNIKPGMETSPKDDLYLYVNYDWLLETDIPEGSRVVGSNLAAEGSDPSLIGSTAHYDGNTNSFHVAAGSVESDVARYEAGEMSPGELMGSPTGYCVFHEIGHALDSIDISIDKDGKAMEGSLLEPDGLKEFERREIGRAHV